MGLGVLTESNYVVSIDLVHTRELVLLKLSGR